MGLFGFGKKKRKAMESADDAEERQDETLESTDKSSENASATTDVQEDIDENQAVEEAVDSEDSANSEGLDELDGDELDEADGQDSAFPPEPSLSYESRGELYGPWDVNDEAVPDYDEYLDLGSYYLPYLLGIQLRIKANRKTRQVLGATVTFGSSSLEIEAFAAPKTMGLWDDMRADLLAANSKAQENAGVFGTELMLPVTIKGGRSVTTRIVGVDGPRWMLRGVFSGRAAVMGGPETDALNKFFADIVVERGDEPLAPRDLIPMHAPITPKQRRAAEEAAAEQAAQEADGKKDMPRKPKGPFDSDQQTQVESTLSRGPMFSEVR